MKFTARLDTAWRTNNSLVCVGLDPEPKKFPDSVRSAPQPIFEFNKAIVDATHDLVCAYKPQFAHYAAHRAEGELERTIAYIKQKAPRALVILDTKRGDIGSTAEQYAIEAFDRYGADAVTINPYLGFDSVEPFLKRDDKGVVILCRTSNAGARDLQDLRVTTDGTNRTLYEVVADKVARDWNANGNCMLVVGATYPEELGAIRARVGDVPFLVPGVGAQGGDVAQAVQRGRTAAGAGLVISSSRAILYASSGPDFAAAARRAATELRSAINTHRA
jgi:orotidine-5'-phosphate decarboxylase